MLHPDSISSTTTTARIEADEWDALKNRLSRMARLCDAFVGAAPGHEVTVGVRVFPDQDLSSRPIRGVQRFSMGPRHRILYVSEREFYREVRDASLAVARAAHQEYVVHRGAWGVPVPASPSPLDVLTAARAARALRKASQLIRRSGPDAFVAKAREIGKVAPSMTPEQRLRAREVIASIDRLVPGRRGCLRRVVAECMLVREASDDVICLALNVGSTGHAYFEGDATSPRFDVTMRLEAN